MSFEILGRDLLGRIGRLKTKSGSLETPAFLPVVDVRKQVISPISMNREHGFQGITTNAYFLKKYFQEDVVKRKIHDFLNFPGVVFTDSGAYQILQYGNIDVQPLEIAEFQEQIDSDIAVILDVPTGWDVNKRQAEATVKETLNRARETLNHLPARSALWVGPIQGGGHIDLVASAAKDMSALPFDIHALGSPTPVMENYFFDVLVRMILAAKTNIPPDRPFHLFGAGHPMFFSFAVALGCDLFDSASYALYARKGRYMTEMGTLHLEDLEYFPCCCEVCSKRSPQEIRELWGEERERMLAKHNLYLCATEIQRIKQHIKEGRLWELLEIRARSHPTLLKALIEFSKHVELIERYTTVSKRRGIFLYDSLSLTRVEVYRHKQRLLTAYEKPRDAGILLLLPAPESKPYSQSSEFLAVSRILQDLNISFPMVHVCFYGGPYALVPQEIDDVFPLSQFESTNRLHDEEATVGMIEKTVKRWRYDRVILHPDPQMLSQATMRRLAQRIKAKITTTSGDPWSDPSLNALRRKLKPESLKRG